MQMVLNELSAIFPCETQEDGKRLMETFLNTYFNAKDILGDDTILIDKDYQNLELSKGYPIAKWRNDVTIDRELRRRFYRMLNHSVTYTKADFGEDALWLMNAEFNYCGMEAKGCLIAYEREDLVISFLSNPCWMCDKIEGTYSLLNENGEFLEEGKPVAVLHVSYNDNLSVFKRNYKEIIAQLGNTALKSGHDILKYHASILPNLVLCKNAEGQLKNYIGVGEVTQVYKKLLELQRYIETASGFFDKNALNNATPESDSTLKQFKKDHTFLLPSGESVVFTWHIRFTGSYSGRIFFHPDVANKRCYIGHIGHKLPTVKYN